MKNLKNKKGFTIVELVIVIAVIAILAAVLIPTFSGVIEKAQKSAAEQNAANLYKEYIASLGADEIDEAVKATYVVEDDNGYYVLIVAGQVQEAVKGDAPEGTTALPEVEAEG